MFLPVQPEGSHDAHKRPPSSSSTLAGTPKGAMGKAELGDRRGTPDQPAAFSNGHRVCPEAAQVRRAVRPLPGYAIIIGPEALKGALGDGNVCVAVVGWRGEPPQGGWAWVRVYEP